MAEKITEKMDVPKPITFEEFEKKAVAILEDHKKNHNDSEKDIMPVLFRGHGDSSYKLKTTLERYSAKQYSPKQYWNVIRVIRPTLETCTGKTWHFSDEYIPDNAHSLFCQPPQEYEFMVHLRHHGFPSPLLDWTKSFYIAAFFAFQTAQADKETDVAIYSFDKMPNNMKSACPNDATIVSCGPTIR